MTSLSPEHAASLIRLQIELEYALDADGRLVPFPGSTEQARFVVHRHSGGYLRYYRHDLPPVIRRRLAALAGAAAFEDRDAIRAVLATQAPCPGGFYGTSAAFLRSPEPAEYPDVAHTCEGFAIVVGGAVCSLAWSSRENSSAAELAVETGEEYRGRGYGRQVAAAWARHVLALGKVAFYSYAEGNVASQALARSLGVVEFSQVAAYE